MIRSISLRQAQWISLRRSIGLRPVLRLSKCVPATVSSIELSSLLVKRASSTPPSKLITTPKTRAKPATKAFTDTPKASNNPDTQASKPPPKTPLTLLYHAGAPRIMFLGGLKVTTALVFGLFTVVTIPTYIETNGLSWQVAGLAVAAVFPLLCIWYLTSPMVMWIHLKRPAHITNPRELVRWASANASTAEIAVLTMAPLGNGRATMTTLAELRPAHRRFGLVNYVRDATKENAGRKWFNFRAVREFKVEEDIVVNAKSQEKWPWYAIRAAMDGGKVERPESASAQSLAPKWSPPPMRQVQTKPVTQAANMAKGPNTGRIQTKSKLLQKSPVRDAISRDIKPFRSLKVPVSKK